MDISRRKTMNVFIDIHILNIITRGFEYRIKTMLFICNKLYPFKVHHDQIMHQSTFFLKPIISTRRGFGSGRNLVPRACDPLVEEREALG